MRPAIILARPVTLELSFPRLIFAMRYQKLEPRLNYARITQESYKRTVQAFHLFQDSAVHPLLCNNYNIPVTRDPLQLQYSAALQHKSKHVSESLACLTVVGIMKIAEMNR